MHGVCRAVSSPLPIEVNGTWLFLYPMTLRDIGSIEFYLLSKRRNQKDILYERFQDQPEIINNVLALVSDEQTENYIQPEELHAFLSQWEGIIMSFWLMFRSQLKYIEVESWLQRISKDETQWDKLIKCRDRVSGFDQDSERDWLVFHDGEDGNGTLSQVNKKINWKFYVRRLCEVYHLTPMQIGDLTLYNFRMLILEEKNVRGARVPLGSKQSKDQLLREQLKRYRESKKKSG